MTSRASIGEVHVEAEGRLYIGSCATATAFDRVTKAAVERGVPVRILGDSELRDLFEVMIAVSYRAWFVGLVARFELVFSPEVSTWPRAVDMFLSVCAATTDRSHGVSSVVCPPSASIPGIPVPGMDAPNPSDDSSEVPV